MERRRRPTSPLNSILSIGRFTRRRLTILTVLTGINAGLVGSFLLFTLLRDGPPSPSLASPPLEARIDRLAKTLTSASKTITAIEDEIEARQQLVADLREDAETYERLADLNQEQVEAVTEALEGELEEDEGASLWRDVVLGAGFLILGSMVTVTIGNWQNRRRTAES